MSRRFVLITLSLCTVAASASAQAPAVLAEARKLLRDGKPAEALVAIEKFQKDLPPNARFFRWRHSWEYKATAIHALLGQKHVYFVLYSPRDGILPNGLVARGPLLNGTDATYDFNEAVTCVEVASGKILWTRKAAGHANLVVDPQTDDLLVWRHYHPYQAPHLFRVAARTGELLLDKRLPETKDRMEGLLLNGLAFTARMEGFGRGNAKDANLYHLAKQQYEKADHRLPLQISPDEKHRLGAYNTLGVNNRIIVSLRTLDGKDELWKYEYATSYSANEPFWLQDDVIALNGMADTRSEIVRLNGKTGKVVWRHSLPRGAYASTFDGLNNRRSPRDAWTAMRPAGKHILALGGDGEIMLLDPKSGERAGAFTPSDAYLVCPRLVDDCIVYCTGTEIAAVPLDLVLASPAAVDERHVIALKAECLASLNRAEEGLKELRGLLQVFPDFAQGWAVKAELCRKMKLTMEEADARCRRLEATGKDHDAVLEQDYGLVKRLATGQKITSTMILGEQLYVGTMAGYIHEFDLGTLEVAGKTDIENASYDPKVRAELRLRDGKTKTLPDDEALKKEKYPWGSLDGRAGKELRYKGKYVRPIGGGSVRILAPDGTLSTFSGSLRGIERWDLYIGPGGPLGHGAGGVYDLDANLAPKGYRIELGRDKLNNRLFTAWQVASDGKTIGILTTDDDSWRLQVYSFDGKTKLRDERMIPAHYPAHYEPSRLHALFDGYLLVGHEIAWVPADAKRPVRQFALQRAPRQAAWKMDPQTVGFLPPVFTATRMFVPSADGAVYVFDTARFMDSRK